MKRDVEMISKPASPVGATATRTPALHAASEPGSPRGLRALLSVSVALALLAPAGTAAHHVGTYTARDNEVSANFKQLKFSIQAKKFGVALRLFEEGALRKEIRARAARLPAGLEAATRAALRAADAPATEVALAVFFAALARDLAAEAEAKVADASAPADARIAAGARFLEAIWRYWSLVDFVVSERDAKSAVAMRLAFDEAETYARSPAAPTPMNPGSGPRPAAGRAAPPDPARLRAPLQRIVQTLSHVVDTLSTSTRRDS